MKMSTDQLFSQDFILKNRNKKFFYEGITERKTVNPVSINQYDFEKRSQ